MKLEINNIAKHFGGIQALNGVTLSIADNELIGVIGPNGAGKSTLAPLLLRDRLDLGSFVNADVIAVTDGRNPPGNT